MTIQRILGKKQSPVYINCVVNYRKNATASCDFSTYQHKSDEYQYLQKSQIPMLHFQRSLPRLKIPELQKTCDRFLAAVKPLSQNQAAYDNFVNLVHRFRTTGSGPQLQKFLQEYDRSNKQTSYYSKPYFEMYLANRKPLPINNNAALVMKLDKRPEYNDQLTRTTNLVITSLRFMRSLREELLEPHVYHMNPKKSDTQRYRNVLSRTPEFCATFVSNAFKVVPLDMSQYQGFFGAARIPKRGLDEFKKTENASHICVMRIGHFYAVNVLDSVGYIESPKTIANRLKFVLNDSASKPLAEFPLGVLTAENRDTWADIREHLQQSNNESALDTIDSALFVLSLDDTADYPVDDPVPIVQNMLHGDMDGLINRWFDKSFSLIVCKDGNAGINFDHSWGDGISLLGYFNKIYEETTNSPICQPSDVHSGPVEDVGHDVFKIEFELDDKSKSAIKQAREMFTKAINSLEMNIMINNVLTKNFCKMHRVSPDAVIQLSLQLAYYRQYGEFVGTYESCSTAVFKHGRTETIRSCTMDTRNLCRAINSKNKVLDKRLLRQIIVNCSETHSKLIKEAATGQGFDRHLFGLKYMAEINNVPLDPIYKSNEYRTLNNNILATSPLSAPSLLFISFGPVFEDGYGIFYEVQDQMLKIVLTSYTGQRNGSVFIESLQSAIDDIHDVLQHQN